MLRLVQLTDSHLPARPGRGFYGIDTDATIHAVLDQVFAWGPDRVIVTGDLSADGSPASYRRLRSILLELNVPVMVLPGNHDDRPVMYQHLLGGRVEAPGQWEVAGWQILGLDSWKANEPGGELSATARDALELTLSQTTDSPTLVFVHHPPFNVGSSWLDAMNLVDGDALIRQLQRHPHVRALACGHVHQLFEQLDGDLLLMTTPSTCSQALPRTTEWVDDTLGPGFRWFTLSGSRMETGVLRTSRSAQDITTMVSPSSH